MMVIGIFRSVKLKAKNLKLWCKALVLPFADVGFDIFHFTLLAIY